MAKNTSILLGDYFQEYIHKQVESGRFNSASELVRAALRTFEYEESKREMLVSDLKKGEESGFLESFDRNEFLKEMREKHIKA